MYAKKWLIFKVKIIVKQFYSNEHPMLAWAYQSGEKNHEENNFKWTTCL